MFTENFNDSNNQIDSFECVTFFALLGNIDLVENWIAKDQVRLYNSKSEFELAYCCFRYAKILKYKYTIMEQWPCG